MKAIEIIKETVLRRSLVIGTHFAWLCLYALIFIMRDGVMPWAEVLFVFCGLLLPLPLSAGIFGDDIASGRIRLLMATPTRAVELYGYRLAGLSLQGAVHLPLACILIWGMRTLIPVGNIQNLWRCLLPAWFLYNAVAAMSATLSVLLRRGQNAVAVAVSALGVLILRGYLVAHPNPASATILWTIKYVLPPVELLARAVERGMSLQTAGVMAYALGLTVAYAAVGVVLLAKREFRAAPS